MVLDLDDNLAAALGSLEVRPMPLELTTSRFDLSFDMMELDEKLYAVVEYNTDLFTEEKANEIGETFCEMAKVVAGDKSITVEVLLNVNNVG